MLDLSRMGSIRVDPGGSTARVEPGVLLADLDRETQAFGLATPLGINSTTGVAGLTLGGGFGWLSRRYGLTIDNLLSADIVTAAGELVRASATDHPDLFWALRGGGGNFGVATSPDELCCWAVMRKAPPLPFLPPEVHGTEVVVLALCHAGNPSEAARAVTPFRAIGKPIADVVGPARYAEWQTAFDPLLTAGERNDWKSHDFLELSDGLIEVLTSAVPNLPSPQCEIFIANLGGAINRVAGEATPTRIVRPSSR